MTGYLLGVDIGGTFTDAVVADSETGRLIIEKVPSTKDDPSEAVMQAVARMSGQRGVDLRSLLLFAHGSTVATNALLESNLPRVALLVTKGFRDVLEIGSQLRHEMFNLAIIKPPPVVPRSLVFEVNERLDWQGNVLTALTEDEVERIAILIEHAGVGACAVSLLFSFRNAAHEQRLAEAIRSRLPEVAVAVSSEVAPEIREYPRTNTTAVNAALQPLVRDYIGRIRDGIRLQGLDCPFFVMQSTGGVLLASESGHYAHHLILSGPAAGVVAACRLAKETTHRDLITFDMGGTSVDICLIPDGLPRVDRAPTLDGRPLLMSQLDIHTIGSGGGSIAWVDSGGFLRVGPHSAGAEPGPACYGRGGARPTVTDAQVVLGRIAPDHFLGGAMKLDQAAAERVVREQLADPLGLSPEEAAHGVLEVIDAAMAKGIRTVSVNRGFDPRNFALVAYGGAGPMHAVTAGRIADIGSVIVPPRPGAFSAFGLVNADIHYAVGLSIERQLDVMSADELERHYGRLIEECLRRLEAAGNSGLPSTMLRVARFRYAWQDNDIEVPIGEEPVDQQRLDEAVARFHALHEKEFGYQDQSGVVEVVAIGVDARAILPHVPFCPAKGSACGSPMPLRTQQTYFRGSGWVEARVYGREELQPGSCFGGPCIVEEREATTVVPPDVEARVDDLGSIILTYQGEST